MTTEKFNNLLKDFNERRYNTACLKSKEYGLKDDRFHNFNVIADLNSLIIDCSTADINNRRLSAVWTTMAKQLSSIIDMINDDIKPTVELVHEKFGDVDVYLSILRAMFLEILENEDVKF